MLQRPGSSWGVQCLAQGHLSRGIEGGYSPHQTIPAGPGIRTHNLPVTSPTRYPLGLVIHTARLYVALHKHSNDFINKIKYTNLYLPKKCFNSMALRTALSRRWRKIPAINNSTAGLHLTQDLSRLIQKLPKHWVVTSDPGAGKHLFLKHWKNNQ